MSGNMATGQVRRIRLPRTDWLLVWGGLLLTCCHYSLTELVPSFVEEPGSVVVKAQNSVVLQCKVTPDTASIQWLHKGQILVNNQLAGIIIDKNSVEIKSFKRSRHEGLYYCIAGTSAGKIRSSPALLSAPSIGEFSSRDDVHIDVTSGNTAVLPCQPPKSNPKAKIIFAFSNGLINDGERHQVLPSGNLHIASVTEADKGVYRCVAVNTVSGKNRTAPYRIHLAVRAADLLVLPMLHTGQTNVTVAAGSDAVFECSASGNPSPTVQWNRYGGVITNRSQRILDNLVIKNVDVRDVGTYRCFVNTTNGMVEKLFALDVQVPPVVHISNPNMIKQEGESVSIECQVRSLVREPKPAIKWFQDSEELDPAIVHGSKVVIAQLEVSDGGLYQCVAIGKTGMVSAVARLEVRPGLTKRNGLTDEGRQPSDSQTDKVKPKGSRKNKGPGHRHERKKKRRKKKKRKSRRKGNKKMTSIAREGKVKLVPPSKPDVTKVDKTSVMVNWTVPANDGLQVTFFRVQYKELKPSKSDWVTLEEDIPKKKWKYHVRGLKPGYTYKFRITAVYTNQDNRFGPNSKRFTLEKGSSRIPQDRPVIAEVIPYDFTNNYSLKVRWQYTSVDAIPVSGFYLEYSPYDEEDWTKITLMEPAVRTYLIKNLRPATNYKIRIKGFNTAGEGDYSYPAVKSTLGKDIRDHPFPDHPFPDHPFPDHAVPDHAVPDHARPTQSSRTVKAKVTFTNATTVATDSSDPVMVRQTTPPYNEPRNSTESSSEMLYMVLGIVLGVLMLALIVFMVMCGIKQRQQRPMMAAGDNIHSKYQDPAHRIYVDAMGKKYMNGGFALNGINGSLPNGHTHCYHGDRQKMNISVNPMSDMEMAQRADNSSMQQQPGLPASPAASDNNFNSIRSSNKNVALQPNGGPDSSDHCRYMGGNSGGDDDEQRSSASGSNESQSSTSSLPDYRHCLALHSNPENPPHCCSCSHSRLNQSRHEHGLQPASSHHRPASGSSSNGSHHHHRRRRKHRSSHEHSTRDQATNTDLSSNDGTMDSSSIPELTKDRLTTAECADETAESRAEDALLQDPGSPGAERRGTSPSHHHIDNSHDT